MNFLLLAVDTFSIGDALLISLLDFVIILIVLGMLIGVIYLLRYFLFRFDKFSNGKSKRMQGEAQINAQPITEKARGSSGEVSIYNVKPRDAAMVMAIVADELKTPLNRLRFKSIKQVGEGEENNEVQG